MGINDRDYYRGDEAIESGSGSNAAPGRPADGSAIKLIIALCIAVLVVQSFSATDPKHMRDGATQYLSLHWHGLQNFELWRVVTYGFSHGSFQHILYNMIGLWCMGRMVEQVRGSRETFAFFIGAIVFSGLVNIGLNEFGGRHSSLIGASGGVCAMVILAAFYFPRLQVALFGVLPIQMRWLAVLYVGIDVAGVFDPGAVGQALNPGSRVQIGYLAHLGGAAFGALYYLTGMRLWPTARNEGSGQRARSDQWLAPESQPQAPVKEPNVKIYVPPKEEMDREVDRILDKINREGKASLTLQENELLMRASEVIRSRMK